MKISIFVAFILVFVASCSSDRTRSSRHPSSENGVELGDDFKGGYLCKYAPIILNERIPNADYDFSSHPFHILGDYAETDTHIFLSYTVIKSLSVFDIWRDSYNNPNFTVGKHMIDTEDVFVVLYKRPGDGRVEPLLYSTNVHGDRAYYFYPAARAYFDHGELDEYKKYNEAFFGGPFDSYKRKSALANKLLKNASMAKDISPHVNGRPLVVSKWGQHSIIGVDFLAFKEQYESLVKPIERNDLLENSAAMVVARNFPIPYLVTKNMLLPDHFFVDILRASCSDDEGMSSVNPNLYRDAITYNMIPSDIANAGLEFPDWLKEAAPDQAHTCLPQSMLLRGNKITSPEMNRFISNEDYIHKYRPVALNSIKDSMSAKDFDNLRHTVKGSFYWAKARDNEKDYACVRFDHAQYFQSLFPKSFAKQQGSLNYQEYPLLLRNLKN